MNTPNGYNEIRQSFGNPSNADGTLNHAWEDANIKKVMPPAGWQLYYQDTEHSIVPISGIRMHRLLESSFLVVMKQIWDHAKQTINASSDDAVRAWLHENRLDQTGGKCFIFKLPVCSA